MGIIKTGDIFYYEDYIPHMDKMHRHKCRVLFVGSENLFYDAWWDGINKWTFVPVRKSLMYYRFSLKLLHRLTFSGFEAIDIKSESKLFLQSPEILLRTTKNKISSRQFVNKPIKTYSETIAFIPAGPKGGGLKPVFFNSKMLTDASLVDNILANQNLNFIQTEEIIIDRMGLYGGFPSYSIKTG